jgi:flavin reductase (DIM6/NTAB) family NADH-FMN oxidoreductase RutF
MATGCRTIRSRRSSQPRPIGWISTRNSRGEVNLAPYSYFNAFDPSLPRVVCFRRKGRSARPRGGEFVVNLVGMELPRR